MPLGGGIGMVLKPDVVAAALDHVADAPGPRIYLTPRGEFWTSRSRVTWPQPTARSFCAAGMRVSTSA